MSIIRGKIWNPKLPQINVVINGPLLFEKCKCGKWRDKKTKEHCIEMSLEELINKYVPKETCIDEE